MKKKAKKKRGVDKMVPRNPRRVLVFAYKRERAVAAAHLKSVEFSGPKRGPVSGVTIFLSGILRDWAFLKRLLQPKPVSLRMVVPGVMEVAGMFTCMSVDLSAENEECAVFDYAFKSVGPFMVASLEEGK